ncbi:MAG: DUF4384 domain-containing protein [Deltaproteobacteria bacterium]|nr:DUF4384 domain-containing protein [Deltaproteobacteria bacterium]
MPKTAFRPTILLTILLAVGIAVPAVRAESGDRVRAKIGIQIVSGDRVMRAKSRDRLKAGDLLRIYVHPERGCYVYVVHSDRRTASLLNTVEQRLQGTTLVMPSLHQYYQVDGKSSAESFTIICSPGELSELSGMLEQGQAPHDKWAEVEADLASRSRIDLSQKSEKPFAIAGNVRGSGGAGEAGGDPFSSKLQIFSGRGLLVKQYEFRVAQ